MSTRAFRLILLVVFLATLSAVALIQTRAAAPPQEEATPPPPPTPGPPPTVAYEALPGQPVETAEKAIQIALEIDKGSTLRQPPLSAEFLAANPDMVVVERYATRQEAEDIVIGGGSDIPEIASEPVWVVRIKGATLVQAIGGSGRVDSEGRGRSAYEEVDEVAYMISERTGQLLAITLSSQPLEKRQPASGE